MLQSTVQKSFNTQRFTKNIEKEELQVVTMVLQENLQAHQNML